ncbi:MAG: reverse transcriptase domain-containing protein [Halioglobus sp.]
MEDKFLIISDHEELAEYFGCDYSSLARLIYRTPDKKKYRQFHIAKKSGGKRTISSPSKALKSIQGKLKDVLYEIYPPRASTHGFTLDRSIVTNAESHLDKKYVFNIDLEDFFGSIHFGRVRNLFLATPFNFNYPVSTILSHICCFQNKLPQGAPTSPVLSNMIAWKLDAQLQRLAGNLHCTYTRYADDISFSFTCTKRRLPEEIVKIDNDHLGVGETLNRLIVDNGFRVNQSKVRLSGKNSRMEVTGLTVNEFANVPRKYVRQISAMINAWRTHGYEAAAKEHNEIYSKRHRASDVEKSFKHVVKGKLAFLSSVRGSRDPIFQKLAIQYNRLVEEELRFRIIEQTDPEKLAMKSLWVIESCYDTLAGEGVCEQGTGFQIDEAGKAITCAHVVANIMSAQVGVYEEIEAYKSDNTSIKYAVRVLHICAHRDIAILQIDTDCVGSFPVEHVSFSENSVEHQQAVKIMGFPGYAPGHSCYIADAKVAAISTESAVERFQIDHTIRAGNSGGPIMNQNSQVVGMAQTGITNGAAKNGCVKTIEILKVISEAN